MYICICKQITEKQIIAAIKNGADNVSAIRQLLGVTSECGSCLDCVEDIIVEYTDNPGPNHPTHNINHTHTPHTVTNCTICSSSSNYIK